MGRPTAGESLRRSKSLERTRGPSGVQTELVSPDAFQAQPHAAMSSEAFYEALTGQRQPIGPVFRTFR